jgi:plasmid stabilization system protein ParE
MARRKRALKLEFTATAQADLLAIWDWNASQYGEAHADKYIETLFAAARRLCRSPESGMPIAEFIGLRRYLVKKRSKGHGHFIIYREEGEQLQVLHLYHSAQDWRRKLTD